MQLAPISPEMGDGLDSVIELVRTAMRGNLRDQALACVAGTPGRSFRFTHSLTYTNTE